nr:ABC transporter ATP-binding protein [Sphingomonas sp. CGMCC 1.13658]
MPSHRHPSRHGNQARHSGWALRQRRERHRSSESTLVFRCVLAETTRGLIGHAEAFRQPTPICGPNGSGKSTLLRVITGRSPVSTSGSAC